jgi:hypothetical protein
MTLSGKENLSGTMFKKASKVLAGMSVELANVRSANKGFRSQLDLKTRRQRKRVILDPNQTFADIDSIKKAQGVAASDSVAHAERNC